VLVLKSVHDHVFRLTGLCARSPREQRSASCPCSHPRAPLCTALLPLCPDATRCMPRPRCCHACVLPLQLPPPHVASTAWPPSCLSTHLDTDVSAHGARSVDHVRCLLASTNPALTCFTSEPCRSVGVCVRPIFPSWCPSMPGQERSLCPELSCPQRRIHVTELLDPTPPGFVLR
jgi:hypothetical protein